MNEKHGPCVDKQCSWCCKPVKVAKGFPNDKIPKDTSGQPIWEKRDEIFVPEDHPETVRLDTYDCKKLNQETGLCNEYENRPEICRNTSCVDETSDKSIDEQYQKMTNEKFFILNNPRKK